MKKRKSNKLSTTKESYAEQLKDRTFFVDRSSGKYNLVNGLRHMGLNVEAHEDHFSDNAADVEWIAECGNRNWIIISSDKQIKKNFLEKQALLHSGVAAFFFTSATITSTQQIDAFRGALRRVANLVSFQQTPFIARISPDGTVELWIDHRGEDLVAKRETRRTNKKK